MTWQPIETAPKDENVRVLLYDAKRDFVVSGVWWVEPTLNSPNGYEPGGAWWATDDDLYIWDDGDGPTHWMPLLAPPAAQEEAQCLCHQGAHPMTPEQRARLDLVASRAAQSGRVYMRDGTVVYGNDDLFPAIAAALAHIDALEARLESYGRAVVAEGEKADALATDWLAMRAVLKEVRGIVERHAPLYCSKSGIWEWDVVARLDAVLKGGER